MAWTRRAFLGALAVGTAGCSQALDRYAQPQLPKDLNPPSIDGRHPIAHLLNRATYGVRPGQIAQVEAIGHEEWLNQQLNYWSIRDDKLELRLRRYDSLKMKARDLLGFNGGDNRAYTSNELAIATLMRALYSERQLYEVMVGFWSDHLSIFHFKGEVSALKTVDDREVIRPYALGFFSDMLRASAHSPAMLVYLDNVLNEKSHPNENYAREIMELHTLGVDGGYTERDIQEVARCFTGWSVNRQGEFEYLEDWHDDRRKTVLGESIPAGGGKRDGEQVLDILLKHPSTARFVCTKLVRRLVADDPPESIVQAAIEAWNMQGRDYQIGNIREAVKAILTHPEFDQAPPKLKRPFELLTSLLRATNAQYHGDPEMIYILDRLGHRPFAWATPDGFPDTALEWSGNLLGRWNLALALFKNELPDVRINLDDLMAAGGVSADDEPQALDFFGRLLLNRNLTDEERAPLLAVIPDLEDKRDILGLLAASPAFQWR